MVEGGNPSLQIKKHLSNATFFKFLFIVRGPPRSGKSTVAAHLAGERGVIIKASAAPKGTSNYDYVTFEMENCNRNKVQTVVIDEENQFNDKQIDHLVSKAQFEHYFVSNVILPEPHQRSESDFGLSSMQIREPHSPNRLAMKTKQL